MEAIISAHQEVISHLRPGSVLERGSPTTAQAFKHSLSRAFTDALIEYHSGRNLKSEMGEERAP